MKYMLAIEDTIAHNEGEAVPMQLWRATFFTAVGCIFHDAHNVFRKGVAHYISDENTRRTMWIVLDSSISSFYVLA
eukprot:9150982-Lingulodinium_polyedra.AAC.1